MFLLLVAYITSNQYTTGKQRPAGEEPNSDKQYRRDRNCSICGLKYSDVPGEVSLLTCDRCGLGSHNICIYNRLGIDLAERDAFSPEAALMKVNPTRIPGLHYLCKACEGETIPNKDPGHVNSWLGSHDQPTYVPKCKGRLDEETLNVNNVTDVNLSNCSNEMPLSENISPDFGSQPSQIYQETNKFDMGGCNLPDGHSPRKIELKKHKSICSNGYAVCERCDIPPLYPRMGPTTFSNGGGNIRQGVTEIIGKTFTEIVTSRHCCHEKHENQLEANLHQTNDRNKAPTLHQQSIMTLQGTNGSSKECSGHPQPGKVAIVKDSKYPDLMHTTWPTRPLHHARTRVASGTGVMPVAP